MTSLAHERYLEKLTGIKTKKLKPKPRVWKSRDPSRKDTMVTLTSSGKIKALKPKIKKPKKQKPTVVKKPVPLLTSFIQTQPQSMWTQSKTSPPSLVMPGTRTYDVAGGTILNVQQQRSKTPAWDSYVKSTRQNIMPDWKKAEKRPAPYKPVPYTPPKKEKTPVWDEYVKSTRQDILPQWKKTEEEKTKKPFTELPMFKEDIVLPGFKIAPDTKKSIMFKSVAGKPSFIENFQKEQGIKLYTSPGKQTSTKISPVRKSLRKPEGLTYPVKDEKDRLMDVSIGREDGKTAFKDKSKLEQYKTLAFGPMIPSVGAGEGDTWYSRSGEYAGQVVTMRGGKIVPETNKAKIEKGLAQGRAQEKYYGFEPITNKESKKTQPTTSSLISDETLKEYGIEREPVEKKIIDFGGLKFTPTTEKIKQTIPLTTYEKGKGFTLTERQGTYVPPQAIGTGAWLPERERSVKIGVGEYVEPPKEIKISPETVEKLEAEKTYYENIKNDTPDFVNKNWDDMTVSEKNKFTEYILKQPGTGQAAIREGEKRPVIKEAFNEFKRQYKKGLLLEPSEKVQLIVGQGYESKGPGQKIIDAASGLGYTLGFGTTAALARVKDGKTLGASTIFKPAAKIEQGIIRSPVIQKLITSPNLGKKILGGTAAVATFIGTTGATAKGLKYFTEDMLGTSDVKTTLDNYNIDKNEFNNIITSGYENMAEESFRRGGIVSDITEGLGMAITPTQERYKKPFLQEIDRKLKEKGMIKQDRDLLLKEAEQRLKTRTAIELANLLRLEAAANLMGAQTRAVRAYQLWKKGIDLGKKGFKEGAKRAIRMATAYFGPGVAEGGGGALVDQIIRGRSPRSFTGEKWLPSMEDYTSYRDVKADTEGAYEVKGEKGRYVLPVESERFKPGRALEILGIGTLGGLSASTFGGFLEGFGGVTPIKGLTTLKGTTKKTLYPKSKTATEILGYVADPFELPGDVLTPAYYPGLTPRVTRTPVLTFGYVPDVSFTREGQISKELEMPGLTQERQTKLSQELQRVQQQEETGIQQETKEAFKEEEAPLKRELEREDTRRGELTKQEIPPEEDINIPPEEDVQEDIQPYEETPSESIQQTSAYSGTDTVSFVDVPAETDTATDTATDTSTQALTSTFTPKIPANLAGGFPFGSGGRFGRGGRGIYGWNVNNMIRDLAGEWKQRKFGSPKQAIDQSTPLSDVGQIESNVFNYKEEQQ